MAITQNVRDKKLRRFIKESDGESKRAARKAARSELLLQEEPGFVGLFTSNQCLCVNVHGFMGFIYLRPNTCVCQIIWVRGGHLPPTQRLYICRCSWVRGVHLPPTQRLCVQCSCGLFTSDPMPECILCCRYLEAEEMERTYRFKQEDIASAVPLASSVQVRGNPCSLIFSFNFLLQYFDLKLDTFGPYSINYSRNGR